MSQQSIPTSWYYLFVHHKKVEQVQEILQRQYPVFIHTSIRYKRREGDKRVRKEECPTISGLIFVQGESAAIQTSLSDVFADLYLVKDCLTGQTACIPDCVMQPFISLSQINPTRIRFMPHTFGYYAQGNPLVRITSGALAGMEGFRIRISRDKCFVTSIGGLTVAIGGIYKENFENLDEYVRIRREQLLPSCPVREERTPLQTEINNSFFVPSTQLDVMAIAQGAMPWAVAARTALGVGSKEKDVDRAAEIALFLLEEIGSHFDSIYENLGDQHIDPKDITSVCLAADDVLSFLLHSVDVSTDLKEIVETGRESLTLRFPFLPLSAC
ncbi:MAG: transcriptional regulator [Mediterranea sp.]|jgi:hypothetical protein|nr:transcriptional regulator [Mediterranea sp.]